MLLVPPDRLSDAWQLAASSNDIIGILVAPGGVCFVDLPNPTFNRVTHSKAI